jgi:N-acetylmuramic acid 6-phosphate (MurNAc-6-P) etherase
MTAKSAGTNTFDDRLGILDASEIQPTFAAPRSRFIGLIAGGDNDPRSDVWSFLPPGSLHPLY